MLRLRCNRRPRRVQPVPPGQPVRLRACVDDSSRAPVRVREAPAKRRPGIHATALVQAIVATMPSDVDKPKPDFARAARSPRSSLLRDVIGLLAVTKKWWLLPIMLMFLLISGLLLASGTAVAPFIYTLF